MLCVDRPVSGRQSTSIILSYQQHYDEADNTSSQLSISRRSPRRYAAAGVEDPSCRRSPPPQQQVLADRRPSPLHLVASDASRRSPRDAAFTATGRPGSGRSAAMPPPISPRDAAAIAAGADRRTTFATQKSFSYDVPSVQPPPLLPYRKQSEPIVGSSGSGQRQRLAAGGGRLLPRLPISGPQLEHHINHLMKYRGGAAAMNLSVDAASAPQQRNADFVAELKELRRQISPSHKIAVKETKMAAPVIHPASGTRRSPVGYDPSSVSELQSTGRRQTFAGQKSLSYEVNQFVQYQPSGSAAERLRDYLDENEIKEFEIEDADGTGVSVWVPPAALSDRGDATQLSRLGVGGLTAGRRASRVGGQRRAYFAEQRSFSCEAASSTPAGTGGHRGTQHTAGHTDAVGRRYTRESNVRLVRQSKTETIDSVEMPPTQPHDGLASRRRDRATAADAEPAVAVYRPHHHQTSEPVVEHASGRSTAIGFGDCDSRGMVVTATGSGGVRYGGDSAERNRKSTKEMRPLERHSSMACGVEERDVDVTAASSGRRHTTGQVLDDLRHDSAGVDVRAAKNAVEARRYGRPSGDGSYPVERSRVLMPEVDKKATDVGVEVHRRTSPRRANVDSGKDTRPSLTQSGGHAATYLSRRTNDLHDNDR